MFRYLAVLTIASVAGLQTWRTLFNNFAVEIAHLNGIHIGVIQSVREILVAGAVNPKLDAMKMPLLVIGDNIFDYRFRVVRKAGILHTAIFADTSRPSLVCYYSHNPCVKLAYA